MSYCFCFCYVGCVVVEPLPEDRAERVKILQRDSSEYIARMGRVQIDRLLLSLSKTKGLSVAERRQMLEDKYNVGWEFVPDRLKE